MHLRPLAAAFVLLGAGFPALAQDVRTDSDTLNSLLACELAAMDQYFIHSRMYARCKGSLGLRAGSVAKSSM